MRPAARGDNGLPVPDGIYVVELVARSEEGEQARAIAEVRLRR